MQHCLYLIQGMLCPVTCYTADWGHTGLVPHTMPRPKEPFHLLAGRTQRRRLRELQHVVTKELAAPYTVKYLPDTGQIVLTPERRVVVTVQPEPTMEERLILSV